MLLELIVEQVDNDDDGMTLPQLLDIRNTLSQQLQILNTGAINRSNLLIQCWSNEISLDRQSELTDVVQRISLILLWKGSILKFNYRIYCGEVNHL